MPPRDAATAWGSHVPVVVLDPGHGGKDRGAEGCGLDEAFLSLALVRRARAMLEAKGVAVKTTRTRDRDVTLEDRVRFSERIGADLFVSVHFNSADEPVQRGGVTTFVLDDARDRHALQLAARENGTSVADVLRMQSLVASLVRSGQAERSKRLASHVHASVLRAARVHHPEAADRGIRTAHFYVLVGLSVPAVLLEASFLTFEPDCVRLHGSDHRQALARGVVEGIMAYLVDAVEAR